MGQLKQLAVLAATAISLSPLNRVEAWTPQKAGDLESKSAFLSPELAPLNDVKDGPKELAFVNVASSTTPLRGRGDCRTPGTGTGNDFDSAGGVKSYEECHKLCVAKPKCNWFTYNTVDRHCFFKTERKGWNEGKRGDLTGPKECGYSCFHENRSWPGTPMAKIEYVEHAARCRYECSIKSGCLQWTYSEASAVCQLFQTKEPVSRAISAARHWSGDREPCTNTSTAASGATATTVPASGCARRGVKYGGDGSGFADVYATDAQTCQDLCAEHPMCEAWAYKVSGNRCHMHIALAEQKKQNDNDFVSGPKWCVSCYSPRSEYAKGAFQEIRSGINTADECQLRCQAASGCRYWSYVPGGACKLMNNDGPRNVVARAISAPKYCGWACDLPNYDAPSPDFGWRKRLDGKDRDACRGECQRTKECKMYTVQQNTCYLKDDTALRGIESRTGSITGFATCSSCFRQGSAYTTDSSNLLWELKAQSAEECRHRCAAMERCTLFNFEITGKQCTLLSGEVGKSQNSDNFISGPVSCDEPDHSCIAQNSKLVGGTNILERPKTPANECQNLCANSPRCHFFTVAPNGMCFHKPADGGRITIDNSSNWTSGTKKCMPAVNGCNEINIDYGHSDIYLNPKKTSNAQQCQQWCSVEPQCRVWMVNKRDGLCWVKTINAFELRRQTSFSAESGARLGCANCLRAGLAYNGEVLKTVNVPRETQCQLACELHKQCRYFTFSGAGQCKLMATMGEVKNVASHIISGPKTC